MNADAWAAIGCDVEDPTGNCVGDCLAVGLVPVGAATFNGAAGYSTCAPLCPTDGGNFVNGGAYAHDH